LLTKEINDRKRHGKNKIIGEDIREGGREQMRREGMHMVGGVKFRRYPPTLDKGGSEEKEDWK